MGREREMVLGLIWSLCMFSQVYLKNKVARHTVAIQRAWTENGLSLQRAVSHEAIKHLRPPSRPTLSSYTERVSLCVCLVSVRCRSIQQPSTHSRKDGCLEWFSLAFPCCLFSAPSIVPIMHQVSSTMKSITLSWPQPEQPNGIILDYELCYYEKVRCLCVRAASPTPFFFLLLHLDSSRDLWMFFCLCVMFLFNTFTREVHNAGLQGGQTW